MAYCYNCGEELYLIDKIGRIDYVICEGCGHEITICDYGQVSTEKIDYARKEFQKKYEENVKGLESVDKTVRRISANIFSLKKDKKISCKRG